MATISGNVIDSVTDLALPGTTVQVKDKQGNIKAGKAADANGYFEISHSSLDDPDSTVILSHIGYDTISMQPDQVGDVIAMSQSEGQVYGGVIGYVTAVIKRSVKSDDIIIIAISIILIMLAKKFFKF